MLIIMKNLTSKVAKAPRARRASNDNSLPETRSSVPDPGASDHGERSDLFILRKLRASLHRSVGHIADMRIGRFPPKKRVMDTLPSPLPASPRRADAPLRGAVYVRYSKGPDVETRSRANGWMSSIRDHCHAHGLELVEYDEDPSRPERR